MHRLTLIMLLSLCFIEITNGKNSDTATSIPMVYAGYGFHLPGGDLASRFGAHSSVVAGFTYKTTKNYIWGVEFDYLFGNTIKEDSILDQIKEENGFVIDISGLYADVFMEERGFRFSGRFGKIIPLEPSSPNSGIILTATAGLLQHKIRIVNKGNTAPQLDKEYLKGYDRLTNGFCLTEFIGYQHISSRNIFNFYAGVELLQAWTKSRRDIDFDTMARDTSQRLDLSFGIRIGWIIPLYGREPREFYYY